MRLYQVPGNHPRHCDFTLARILRAGYVPTLVVAN
jgi:hypothetical protein